MDFRSCEDLGEWLLPEIDDIAESIEDVRGGPLVISARYIADFDAMTDDVLLCELTEGVDFRTGSETLRDEPFVSILERIDLQKAS